MPAVTVAVTQTVMMVDNPTDAAGNPVALPLDLNVALAPGVTGIQLQQGSSQQVLPGKARIVPVAVGNYPGAVILTATRADSTVATVAVDVNVTVGPFATFAPTFEAPVNKP